MPRSCAPSSSVATERQLTALYLLTVADIRGTSPKVWNAWKGAAGGPVPRHPARAGRARRTSRGRSRSRKARRDRLLNLRPCRHDQAHGAVGRRSRSATSPATTPPRSPGTPACCHARCRRAAGRAGARRRRLGEGLQVLVYAPTKADLFARICGYFDSAGFNIPTPRCTRRAGHALDTLPDHQPAPGPAQPRPDRPRRDAALAHHPKARLLPEPAAAGCRAGAFRSRRGHALRPDERAQRWLLAISAKRPNWPALRDRARPRAPSSTCSSPRSRRSASASKTPFSSTARRCNTIGPRSRSRPSCWEAVAHGPPRTARRPSRAGRTVTADCSSPGAPTSSPLRRQRTGRSGSAAGAGSNAPCVAQARPTR